MSVRKYPLSRFARIALLLLLCVAGLLAWRLGRPGETGRSGSQQIKLAAFQENEVRVVISLERDKKEGLFLAATFTPQIPGFHLYSKDLPKEGLDGLGRPTLLELAPSSRIAALGDLTESVSPSLGPAGSPGQELPVYPAGPVILRLPVRLPPGSGPWVEEQVSVTYMLCSGTKCKRPVVSKLISLRVPVDSFKDW